MSFKHRNEIVAIATIGEKTFLLTLTFYEGFFAGGPEGQHLIVLSCRKTPLEIGDLIARNV